MHVSSSFRYDQMSASDLRFGARVFVARGHEPSNPNYCTHEIKDIGGLPALVAPSKNATAMTSDPPGPHTAPAFAGGAGGVVGGRNDVQCNNGWNRLQDRLQ